MIEGKGSVFSGRDGTGEAVILPSSKHPVVDDYLKYQQQEKANALKQKKPFELPSDYSGINGLMGRVFDPDIVPLSQKLEGIKQQDAVLKAQRMNGQISDADYIKRKQEIDHVKYGELMPQLIQSVRDREFFDRNYPQWRNAPEKHPQETGDYLMSYDQLPIGQRQKPELMKQLSEVDFSSILQGGIVPEVRTVKKINPDGSTTETVRTEVSPVELRTSAELAAKDKTVKGQALKKAFEAEVPNGSEEDYVKWIEKQKLAKNKWTIRSAYKEGFGSTLSGQNKPEVISDMPPITERHNQQLTSGESSEETVPVTTKGGISFSTPQSVDISGVEYFDPTQQKMMNDIVGARKASFQNIVAYPTLSEDRGGMKKGTILHDNPNNKYLPQKTELYVPVVKTGADEGQTVYIPLHSIESQLKLSPSQKKLFEEKKAKLLGQNQSGKQSFTKDELTKKALKAGYTFDEYYPLVKNKVDLK